MRSPADNAADEAKAAIDTATDYLDICQRHGWLRKRYIDLPDEDLRMAAQGCIAVMPDDMLPAPLRIYVCRLLQERPTTRRTNRTRDACIAGVVRLLVDRGFDPTRNAAKRGKESACSIVQKVLAHLGLHLSERTIEDIWNDHRDLHRKNLPDSFVQVLPELFVQINLLGRPVREIPKRKSRTTSS